MKTANSYAIGREAPIIPPIGLERPIDQGVDKNEQSTFKLRSVPTQANSPTYELSIRYFGTGTPEEWLRIRAKILEVITGQNFCANTQPFLWGSCPEVPNTKFVRWTISLRRYTT